ncbi:hypothetical protein PRIPAC_78241 [Pristionchus pacificus]|uniref:Uncharacterized protein n=1 Tax=Pristionchus pacificus TaxID=54126 RepID=A0A2A6C2H9_PRIPA|nr:hypothetical protein PRIPAC_78241 [Pristionchus pacificus]|eukprot:PDM72375.1 hypothetical protein PRIPAC_38809 [Pristionchus pacificus]
MDVTYSLDTLTMHSTSVLLLASAFTVVVAFAVAETNNEHVPAFAFMDRRGNEGKFAYNRFTKRSSGGDETDSKFAFAFAKRSAPQDDAVEQVVQKFARRFAREVMNSANERGFAFA